MHTGKGSTGFPKLSVSGRDGWRLAGTDLFFSPSLAHPEYIRHFTTKTALVMTEGVGLISEPEGEIIHQKPSLDPLRNMAPVKGSFFFSYVYFSLKPRLVQSASRNCGEGLLTIRRS